ncbi:MAG: fibronectin type III domain-containing protein, partial [Anaerolineae bacterium]
FDDLTDPAQWTFDGTGAISGRPAVGPDGTVYVGTTSGYLYAVRGGSLLWQRNLGTAIPASPALDNNQLYVTTGGDLYALSLGSGATLWSIGLGGSTDGRSTPVVANHAVYVTRSDGVLAGVTADHLIPAPSNVLANPVPGQPWNVEVSWEDNSDNELDFNLEVCELTGTCVQWATAPADATQTTLPQIPPSTLFYVRVQAQGGFGGGTQLAATAGYDSEYGYSDAVMTLPSAPQAPANLNATALSGEAIALTWTYGGSDAEILSGFNIYRSESAGGPYTLAGSTAPSTMAFKDVELTADTLYYYRVRAVNDGGESGDSNTASATTKALTLAAPTDLSAEQQADNTIDLSWTDNAASETGYVIGQKFEGEGTFTPIATLPAGSTSHTVPYHRVSDGLVTYEVKAVSGTAESAPATTVLEYAVRSEYDVFLPFISLLE